MMVKVFKSESVKLKRSFLLYLHLIVLVLFPIILAIYYGARSNIVSSRTMIITFFEILAMATPIMISIVISMVYDREEKAGTFKNWLSEAINKSDLIQLQLMYYWIWYVIEIVGISLIFYLIITVGYHVSGIAFNSFILTSIAFAILALFQYEITEIIALKWGVGGALVLGFFGTVISLLGITSLLDFIWPVVPWTWQIRLITFWQSSMSSELARITLIEYLIPLIFTVIILVIGKNYFTRWQYK